MRRLGRESSNARLKLARKWKKLFIRSLRTPLNFFITVQESDAVRERYPMLFMNQRAPGHGDPCIKVHLDLRKPIAASCWPRAYRKQTLRRSRIALCASRRNSSHIAGKEEKPDAKWLLSASNRDKNFTADYTDDTDLHGSGKPRQELTAD